MKHDAFISYSRRDSAIAEDIERRLERYKPPKGLGLPQRHLDIFRDKKDFTGTDYESSLETHLGCSSALIVLCSPDARKSIYVNEEIRKFAREKGSDKVVPVLVSGIPNNESTPGREGEMAFPEALYEYFEMPLAVDYREYAPGKSRVDSGEFFDQWFTLLANIFGISRSEIEQRERKRRKRKLQVATASAASVISLLVIALIITLISRSEAITQAIAARHQTSTRLAIQALEKLDGSPETALQLAIQAVQTYHQHGDPPVSRALEALHKARLSFGGGRPAIPWRNDQSDIAFSSDLNWVATTSRDGVVRLSRSGSGQVFLPDPPDNLLGAGEVWSEFDQSKLLFTKNKLVAARLISTEKKRTPKKAAIWFWQLGDSGVVGPPEKIALIKNPWWSQVRLTASGDGRWLSWGNGNDLAFLAAINSPESPISFESRDSIQLLRGFSEDSTEFAIVTDKGLQIVDLESGITPRTPELQISESDESANIIRSASTNEIETQRNEEYLQPLPGQLLKSSRPLSLAAAISIATRFGPRRDDGSYPRGIGRVALMFVNGDVEWWDLDQEKVESTTIGSIYSAYVKEMQVIGLEKNDLSITFEFGRRGHGLLAAVAHNSGEFGIVSWFDLDAGDGWKPLVMEQLQNQLTARLSRTEGTQFGATSGYRLFDQKPLGAADAWWLAGVGILTLGMDGTLLYRDLESGRSHLVATGVRSVVVPRAGKWLPLGMKNGKVRLVDFDDKDRFLELNAHDRPVSFITEDYRQSSIFSYDDFGVSRVWRLQNPVIATDDLELASLDWHWAKSDGDNVQVWDLSSSDPYGKPVDVKLPMDPDSLAIAPGNRWAATMKMQKGEPRRVRVNLWRIHDHRLADKPEQSREFTFTNLPERWRWSRRGRLFIEENKARFVLTGQKNSHDGLWVIDLLDQKAAPRQIVNFDDKFELRSISQDLRRILISRYDRNSREDNQIQVLDLVNGTNKPLLTVPGTAHGDLSPDGRWLKVHNRLFDLSGDVSQARLEEDKVTFWPYRFIFAKSRPPLLLDDSGVLWGLDDESDSRKPPQKLLSGLDLSTVAWDESATQLLLGANDGRVWVVEPPTSGGIDTLWEALKSVASDNHLPVPWDNTAKNEIRGFEYLGAQRWLLARTDNGHVIMWRGLPESGWTEPLVFDRRSLFDSGIKLQCRDDGQQCLLGGQFLTFNEEQLLSMSKVLLSGWDQNSALEP